MAPRNHRSTPNIRRAQDFTAFLKTLDWSQPRTAIHRAAEVMTANGDWIPDLLRCYLQHLSADQVFEKVYQLREHPDHRSWCLYHGSGKHGFDILLLDYPWIGSGEPIETVPYWEAGYCLQGTAELRLFEQRGDLRRRHHGLELNRDGLKPRGSQVIMVGNVYVIDPRIIRQLHIGTVPTMLLAVRSRATLDVCHHFEPRDGTIAVTPKPTWGDCFQALRHRFEPKPSS